MSQAATEATPVAARIDEIADRLQLAILGEPAPADLGPVRRALADLASDCRGPRPALARALSRLSTLTELWECRAAEPDGAADEIGLFCVKAMAQLARSEARGGDDDEVAARLLEQSSASWGDYLCLLEDASADAAGDSVSLQGIDGEPEREGRQDTDPEPDLDEPPAIDAQALLRLFGATPSAPPNAPPPVARVEPTQPRATPPRAEVAPALVIPPLPRGLDLDDEIREAFLADATDLFERIQSLVLDVGAGGGSPESFRELGRCLHTLKGAAGSVGLGELSALVHGLEERLDGGRDVLPPGLVELLHGTLAYLEGLLGLLRGGHRAAAPPAETPPVTVPAEAVTRPEAPTSCGSEAPATAQEGPIRVASARFDELLDVASELIARRRSWMGQAESLKAVAAMARGLRGRMHACLDRLHEAGLGREDRATGAINGPRSRRVDVPAQLRKLGELDDDLAVIAETAMAAATPLADHGDALGRLTMQLWDELQSIRIVPVRGLFQRLARVALDAARVEGRQIEVAMVGDQAGLDRAVQDKAYEPLLHVVRNAVGHGIEAPEERARAGKPAAGKITLEARREGNGLAISVHDDGRGLDHSAIEAKARRLGLVAPTETPSVERLNELIFHSGFSTRDAANAISGRGVGMDVVAREVGLLRGTIELRTERGRGTRMTVRLPGRLALETVMIARVDGQAFAIPVALIEHAQPIEPKDLGEDRFPFRGGEIPLADAREILGVATTPWPAWPKLLVVRSAGGPVGLVVDAIEGTEELVIKPLNALLSGHPLVSGTSVLASGEVICVLNLAGLHGEAEGPRISPSVAGNPIGAIDRAGRPVLVVDDSISVRRVMARQLRSLGFAVDEVSDGQEALVRLRDGSYCLVVTDLEMPRLDGLGLLSEIRRIASLATIPVIVASTRSDEETQQKVRSLGARAFLPKPVDPAALAEVVRGSVPRPDRPAGPGDNRTAEEPWKAR
ncbi:hybrid sensor histidine kinase/response regulator [Aquisphaera insulae]|uniref:hybrid sensor histidine kinase/response regulator n=1 Tax=Aquisphaera insulae TaxID=2712864 RepID=UPI0013EB1A10|nr:response regulator [Aquisphaera insulae]